MSEQSWSVVSKDDETDRLFGWNLSPKSTNKRAVFDECFYSKAETTETSDAGVTDPDHLRSLVQSALKVKPFRGHEAPKKISRRHLLEHPSVRKQYELLQEVQRGIDCAQQDLMNRQLLEEFLCLEKLRPCLTKRFRVVLGEYLPESIESNSLNDSFLESIKEEISSVTIATGDASAGSDLEGILAEYVRLLNGTSMQIIHRYRTKPRKALNTVASPIPGRSRNAFSNAQSAEPEVGYMVRLALCH